MWKTVRISGENMERLLTIGADGDSINDRISKLWADRNGHHYSMSPGTFRDLSEKLQGRDFDDRPTDERGHHVRVSCNIPPDLASRVSKLMESHKFPFGIQSDLIRDAIANECDELEEFLGEDISAHPIAQLNAIIQTSQADKARVSQLKEAVELYNNPNIPQSYRKQKLAEITDVLSKFHPVWQEFAISQGLNP